MIGRKMRTSSILPCIALVGASGLISGMCANRALAIGLTYIEADMNSNLTGDVFTTDQPSGLGDGHWDLRAYGSNGTIYESGGPGSEVSCAGCTAEGAPEITQTISGLDPGSNYDVYAVYWTSDAQVANWRLRTGLVSGSLTLYDETGTTGVAGTSAAAAAWASPPSFFHEADRSMLLGYAGTKVADAGGQIAVFVNDLPGTGDARSSFDGIAYVPANTQIAIKATINRTTGSLVIDNPTLSNFQIKSYSVNSPAGALNATVWDSHTISGHLDNGSSAFDADDWNVTAPASPSTTFYATSLAEAEDASAGGSGGTLAAAGGGVSTLDFGNSWVRTPIQDVAITLSFTDGTVATIVPQYTGTAITNGDFDLINGITLTDYQTLLTNMQTNLSSLSQAEAYQHGDMTRDRNVDFADFLAFRTAYNASHGTGSFEQMVAQIPEPGSLMLLLMAGVASFWFRRPRTGAVLAACIACLSVAAPKTASALNIAVDIDTTRISATDVSGTISTQPGYTSWNLTNVQTAGSTITVDGILFEIFGLAAANQSRIRPEGGGGGANDAQLKDFVYNEGASNRAIGLRVTNLPIGTYNMQSWHYDATGSVLTTENFTKVEVRNSGGASTTLLSKQPFGTTPLNFSFDVTAAGQIKEVIFREDDAATATDPTDQNRARLNAFTLQTPPNNVELTLEVNTTTGATRFVNEQGVSFDMSYYEIRSSAGSLRTNGWVGFDDTDPGSDPVGTGWDKVPASNSKLLNEVNLTSATTFAPGNVASLGSAFTLGGAQDIQFKYAGPNETILRDGIVKYVSAAGGVAGDYNGNGVVDGADYVMWRKGGALQNEGRTSGVNDVQDYNFWRARLGSTATSGSGSALDAAQVPEPAAVSLVLLTMLLSVCQRLRWTGARLSNG